MTQKRNERLAAILEEAGWSRAQAASAFNRVAQENNLVGYTAIGRSHVSMWVGGTEASGASPVILSQALTRRLGRVITPDELGFAAASPSGQGALDWIVDPILTLTDLGRSDLDVERRKLLTGAVYSIAGLALPGESWWEEMAAAAPAESAAGARRAGRSDVAAVREMTAAFSRMDQSRGGGHGRQALVQYLHSDVRGFLQAAFPNDEIRRGMLAAAGELSYLSGWMALTMGNTPSHRTTSTSASSSQPVRTMLRSLATFCGRWPTRPSIWASSTKVCGSRRHRSKASVTRALRHESALCSAWSTPGASQPQGSDKPQPRHFFARRMISLRPVRASRSRTGRSSSRKRPLPMKLHAHCVTPVTGRARFASSSGAYGPGVRHSVERMP